MKKINPASRWFLLLLVMFTMVGALSTDIYLPSLPDLVRLFHTDVSRVQLTLSVFFAGFAVSQLLHGPLSDRYGRRPVLFGGIVLYMAATTVCIFANTVEMLIVGRFFQAVGACAGPVLARAIVRDVFPRDQAARAFATMASIFAVTPAVAPIVGGNLHALFGWHSNFIVMLAFGVAQLFAVWLLLSETLAHPDLNAMKPGRMVSNYLALLKDRIFIGNALLVSLVFSGMFTLISSLPFIVIDILGVRPEFFGYCMTGLVCGFLTGSLFVAHMNQRLGSEVMVRLGLAVGFAAALVLAGLAWAGVHHLAAILVPGAFLFMANALVMPNATALAIAPHARIAGSASALLGFLQMTIASFAGWLGGVLHNGTTVPFSGVILGALTLAGLMHRLFLYRKNA